MDTYDNKGISCFSFLCCYCTEIILFPLSNSAWPNLEQPCKAKCSIILHIFFPPVISVLIAFKEFSVPALPAKLGGIWQQRWICFTWFCSWCCLASHLNIKITFVRFFLHQCEMWWHWFLGIFRKF